MISVDKIAKLIDGQIIGDKTFQVEDICDVEKGKKNCITYLSNSKYKKYLKDNNASVIVVNNDFKEDSIDKNYIKVSNPALSFIDIINLFHPPFKEESKIYDSALICKNAKLGKDLFIGPNVIIEEKVEIGDNVMIGSGTFIARNTKIGSNTKIFSNVSIYHNTVIGSNCKIDSGTIIGADGFGLVKGDGKNKSIPHSGNVIIKDDVFIGANCCIDRGTINDTIISENCRFDNLIQIGHNVQIGRGCVMAAQVGIAGSVIIKDNVTIAGQVGIIDHIVIEENTVITAKSLVCNSVEKGSFLSGNPAQPHRDFLRQQILLRNLDKENKDRS